MSVIPAAGFSINIRLLDAILLLRRRQLHIGHPGTAFAGSGCTSQSAISMRLGRTVWQRDRCRSSLRSNQMASRALRLLQIGSGMEISRRSARLVGQLLRLSQRAGGCGLSGSRLVDFLVLFIEPPAAFAPRSSRPTVTSTRTVYVPDDNSRRPSRSNRAGTIASGRSDSHFAQAVLRISATVSRP